MYESLKVPNSDYNTEDLGDICGLSEYCVESQKLYLHCLYCAMTLMQD